MFLLFFYGAAHRKAFFSGLVFDTLCFGLGDLISIDTAESFSLGMDVLGNIVRFLEERGRKSKRKGYSHIEWQTNIEALRQLMGHSANSSSTFAYLTYMSINDTIGSVLDDVGDYFIEMMSEHEPMTEEKAGKIL